MVKENIRYFCNNCNKINIGHSIIGFGPCLIAALLATVVLWPISNALAASNDDFDHDEDIGEFDRTVETITTNNDNDIFSLLPTDPEKGTLTGNNDGPEIKGTHGDKIIVGTDHNDKILGRDDAFVINGGLGSDTIKGGDQEDTIQGGEGNEQIFGKDGNDVLSGGFNEDYLSGGDGMDQLFGDLGDDTLKGGDGADYYDCGEGFDVIYGFDSSQGDTKTPDCEVTLEEK